MMHRGMKPEERSTFVALSPMDVFAAACKGLQKWGLHLSWAATEDMEELEKAAPCLKQMSPVDLMGFMLEGQADLFFDTEKKMLRCFNSTVGEDGPTKTNPYDGPMRVFALTCSPDGNLLSENT